MQFESIPEYEDRYLITRDGSIWSAPYTRKDGRKRKGLWLKPAITRYGYKHVVLTSPCGKRSSLSVHRLVARTYLKCGGNIEDMQVNHIDGDKLNNSVDNLEWCTQEENLQHAHRTGLIKIRKISPEDVVKIKELIAQGLPQVKIAAQFGIDPGRVSKIKSGLIYKEVY